MAAMLRDVPYNPLWSLLEWRLRDYAFIAKRRSCENASMLRIELKDSPNTMFYNVVINICLNEFGL